MGFLSPLFLGGLLAAALPIYIHLLKQHRSEPQKFSSLMFLERRTQSSVKHRRLKYLTLFALRLAMILLLALMFANPFIRRSVAASGGRKFVAVAVDNSFSMRTGDRLLRAKQAALDAIDTMGAGDRGQVMTFASTVQMLSQATSDKAELQRAVQGIQHGDGKSAYGEISRTLRSMARPDGLSVEA
ncbi:MAG: BatA domain-containing protein, partial [Bryobacteraceae bacterium]|nr:BatA domain-containing protein [Bryobacteraceae bacterium]